MTISFIKNTVAASRSLGRTILLVTAFGDIPVRVTSVVQASTDGSVTLAAETVNGSLLVRTVNGGQGYAALVV